MLLSIVTLNYKKPDLTIACLTSLQDQFTQEFENNEVELIIVDNASSDGSVEEIKTAIKNKRAKNIHLIASPENGGFAKGCNLGAQKSKGEFVVFLNNDTLAKDNGLLKMAEYMKAHEKISILGGQLRNSDGTLQSSAGKFYTPFNAFLLLLGLQKFGVLDKSPKAISEVDWVKGGLLMIRKNVFEKLGGFDEKIFMYTEDMELCYRAKLAGYTTFFYPDVHVVHAEHGSASRSFAIVNIYKNLLYFYKKHRSPAEYRFLKLLMKIKAHILVISGKIVGKAELTKTYEEALSVIR